MMAWRCPEHLPLAISMLPGITMFTVSDAALLGSLGTAFPESGSFDWTLLLAIWGSVLGTLAARGVSRGDA